MSEKASGDGKRKSLGRRLRGMLFALIAVVLGLALIEGLCSLGLFVYDLVVESEPPLAERRHTVYDAEIGWVNEPSRRIEDLYGPGRTLTINAQGFRNLEEFDEEIPEGRLRIVASGDSFTLGYGMDDGDTWCAALERRDPRYQVVNMGQGGYGLDQIYLWYQRDGYSLKHQIHIFAVVPYDVFRMMADRFMGYGKPVLKAEGGVPVADLTPVPKRSYFVPWLTQNAELIGRLRTAQLLSRTVTGSAGERTIRLSYQEAGELATMAVKTMHERDEEHGSRLVFVWLPTLVEHEKRESDGQRESFITMLRRDGILAIDLVDELRRLPKAELKDYFITHESGIDYPGAVGHYSEKGNRFVAELIEKRLRAMPELAGLWR